MGISNMGFSGDFIKETLPPRYNLIIFLSGKHPIQLVDVGVDLFDWYLIGFSSLFPWYTTAASDI